MGEIKSLGWGNKPIDTKATSIEAQVAAYIITDLQTKDKEVSPELIYARNAWLKFALRHFMEVKRNDSNPQTSVQS